jgi:hypothetical protein
MQDLAVFPDRAVYTLETMVATGGMAEHTLLDILVHILAVAELVDTPVPAA